MASKQGQMVQTLLEQNQRLNAAQLASQLGISVRTVHNYINEVNDQFPGAIQTTPEGYHIEPQQARLVLQQEPNEIPQTAAERCNYILNRLAQGGGSIPLEKLCEEIFISVATFNGLLGRMRRLTREYDLTLHVSGEVVTLSGTERNKRRLLSALLYRESAMAFTSIDAVQEAFPSIDVEKIRDIVLKELTEHHYFINDYSLINLVLHIAIAIHRLKNGCINSDENREGAPLHSHEQQLADDVVAHLQQAFGITFSPAESYEIALLLVSRASALDYQAITPENIADYIGKDCDALVRLLMRTVRDLYAINLDEPEFYVRFALHIRNLLVRASNKALCKNPLVSEIRQTCPMIYDVSVQLSGIILEQTGISIDDDEIAYIALHLGGTLETQRELSSRISTVLYCPSYYNMDGSLAERLSRRLDGKIVLTNVCTSERELAKVGPQVLIISTVRPHSVLDSPLVIVSPFLTNTDCVVINRKVEEINAGQKRAQFRHQLSHIMSPELFECGSIYTNREEVIHHMCEHLAELGYSDETFENEVLKREQISSTGYNQFAIPHTLKMRAKRTGMYIYISRTPIPWGDNMVSMVVLLCFNPEERKLFYDIFEPLSMLLLDANVLKGALACRDYGAMIEYLVSHME